MWEYFVCHAYVFHTDPQNELPFVDIPALSQSVGPADSVLVQMEAADLIGDSKKQACEVSRSVATASAPCRPSVWKMRNAVWKNKCSNKTPFACTVPLGVCPSLVMLEGRQKEIFDERDAIDGNLHWTRLISRGSFKKRFPVMTLCDRSRGLGADIAIMTVLFLKT